MRKPLNFLSVIALASGLVLTSGCSTVRPDKTADTLYLGGDILTMNGEQPSYAEAVAVKDGKILFVGTKAEALKLKGDGTEIRGLSGKALLPGFLDAHSHYINCNYSPPYKNSLLKQHYMIDFRHTNIPLSNETERSRFTTN
jgi:hypothetical protein